jgi:hypothetical protein
MPMQAFIDESGIDGSGPVLVFAGYIGKAENWARFSNEWQAVLDREPQIPVFRMHDAAARKGAFAGWARESRDERLREFVQVVGRYPLTAIHCSMDIAGHGEILKREHSKPLNQLYFWPFQIMILAVAFELVEQGCAERFEIVFDVNDMFGPKAKAWYPIIRAVAEVIDADAYAILPAEPIFKSDDEFLPLQAADMLAWLFRRAWTEAANPDPEFGWIATELQKTIPMSAHAQVVPKERMAFWVSLSRDQQFSKGAVRIIQKFKERGGLGGYPF